MVAVYMLTGIAGNLLSMATDVFLVSHRRAIPRTCFRCRRRGLGSRLRHRGHPHRPALNRRLPFPWTELRRLRSSVVKFAAINLVIGLSTIVHNVGIRIDNSAHIGGFLSGLALGVPLVPRMTSGRERLPRAAKRSPSPAPASSSPSSATGSPASPRGSAQFSGIVWDFS